MKKFLCTFSLPRKLDQDFWELIPGHRQYINTLMQEEIIITYSINHNRSKGWVVLSAASEKDAVEIINQFPIRRYLTIEMDELFIFDSMIGAPKLIMN